MPCISHQHAACLLVQPPLCLPPQATCHLAFDAWHTQYLFICSTLVLLLCLSLPINGTHWKEDLQGWTAADWGVLGLLGSVINIGMNLATQHAIWQLGAPTVAMFVGLRLVCAVVLSKAVLGVTTIQTAVQVRGLGQHRVAPRRLQTHMRCPAQPVPPSHHLSLTPSPA